ncbi:hypothetical protein [Microbacterium aerolatum]|uniref:hypothetical protein n=1 Tax=Microbacterium aerolatum TaxID=153731 RepID=UPI00384FD7AB
MAATTPRKPADRKTPTRKPSGQNKTATAPRVASRTYTVEDDVLHYTTKAGHVLVIDLDFSPDLVKIAMGADDDDDRPEEEQFEIFAANMGDNFQDAYAVMGVIERKRLQTAVFSEFAKAMGLEMGESSGSSRS